MCQWASTPATITSQCIVAMPSIHYSTIPLFMVHDPWFDQRWFIGFVICSVLIIQYPFIHPSSIILSAFNSASYHSCSYVLVICMCMYVFMYVRRHIHRPQSSNNGPCTRAHRRRTPCSWPVTHKVTNPLPTPVWSDKSKTTIILDGHCTLLGPAAEDSCLTWLLCFCSRLSVGRRRP